MTPNEAASTVAAVSAAWPNPVMPDIVIEAWIEAVEPLDYHRTYEAMKELIKTHTYRPTPGELVDAVTPAEPFKLLEFKPREVEGVLPPETQLARIQELRSTLRHIDDITESPSRGATQGATP